ncbi:zinc finger protein 354A-like [Littorina saxatilis]|uniref:zinc finger protein 354A-like n=1 Tax=Littorina saxatilis TaxID=31220 RepID=UPI0038B613E7
MEGADWEILHMGYVMSTELANFLRDDHGTSPGSADMDDEESDNPSGIGLHLECEDDKSYALPYSKNSLQLHSNNVNMSISFSSPSNDLSCRYCKCNFLSESHLAMHMEQFHLDSDDDCDDKVDVWNGVSQEPAATNLNLNHSNGVAHDVVAYPHSDAAVVPTLFSKSIVKKTKSLKLKRKSVSKDRPNGNPPLTLTIKKSRSDSEIQQGEHTPIPESPGPQLLHVKCEVQSDSANETIDVESSSPSSSPTSVKSRLAANFSLKKHVPGMPFTCDICMKTYVSKYALKRHIATHSDERPFICSFPGCKGAFKLKSRLTDHVRYVHKRKTQRTVSRSKSLPVTASPSLAQALLSPSSLSAPKNGLLGGAPGSSNGSMADSATNGKVSSTPKTFKCSMPNCNREFRDSHNLRTHMFLHTGHMPLKCSHCEYRCVQKSALDWHMKSIHAKSL